MESMLNYAHTTNGWDVLAYCYSFSSNAIVKFLVQNKFNTKEDIIHCDLATIMTCY